jgi:hypothetical protein
MNELIKALIKARSEFDPIKKDKKNPHFKVAYASLDSVLEAVTPSLCKHGLAIVQLMERGGVLKTQLLHESGEMLTSEYELPDTQDQQKKGAAITYARRYSICALLSITSDEDTDGNNGDSKLSVVNAPKTSSRSVGDKILQVREFLGIDKSWVVGWLDSHGMKISDIKDPSLIIQDMCVQRAIVQGVDESQALSSYLGMGDSPPFSAITAWWQSIADHSLSN